MADRLTIVPLGGLGEIGKNMMAIESGEDIVIVDAGLMFPEEEMLGVDLVIPDVTYVAERINKLRAIIIIAYINCFTLRRKRHHLVSAAEPEPDQQFC